MLSFIRRQAAGLLKDKRSLQDLARHFPTLEPAGVDLMDHMFAYNPADRITVRAPPAPRASPVRLRMCM